jgi:small-conductance mechanosensitive channel
MFGNVGGRLWVSLVLRPSWVTFRNVHVINEMAALAAAPTAAEITEACGVDASLICKKTYEWTNNDVLAQVADWALDRPLKILFILVVGSLARRLSQRLINRLIDRVIAERDESTPSAADLGEAWRGDLVSRKLAEFGERVERSKQRAQTLGVVAKNVTTATIAVVAGLMVMGELNINLGPLIAGAGILGVAIGFGAQSLVKDVISGVFMLIEDQYGVGDVVDVGEAVGTVEEVGLRTTRLRGVDGTLWFVPNGEIRRVGNMSQLWARAVLDIDVAYDTDIEHASTVMKQIADELWHEAIVEATILEEPAVLGVQNFGADAVAIRLSVKTDPSEQWAVGRLLRRRLKDAFDAEGIEIPFPQRTVWLKNDPDGA